MSKYQNPSNGERGKVTNWEFNNIQMGYAHSFFSEYSIFKASNDNELVRLHFGLKGDYRFTYKQLNQSFDLAGGHHNIMYSKGIDLEIENKTLEIETFGIDFPKELFIQFTQGDDDDLKRFVDSILNKENSLFSQNWGTIDSKIQGVIDEIILNQYSGVLQDVFLLAKSLELLVLCVDNYKSINNVQPQYIRKKADKEKIIAARDFINERITSPPNLSEIARHVGLNEFKLKHGFKETFHDTIFGYLTERRLNLAQQFLKDTDKSVAEIAIDLGYSSPQHFSHQFKNKFGNTPNSVRKTPN